MGNKPLQIAVASVAWVAALVTANAWVAPMKGAATVLQLNASNLSYYASSVFLSRIDAGGCERHGRVRTRYLFDYPQKTIN